ncbi:hypothetical protein [Bradyrhizobium canariense]|uniref:Uncharacterized protein n=1 Tax=Bradyrhizobium canariense TaxID=255045 RepID=A0A1H2BKQ2_9BRAD|nr:hypothetical protein [Bradyrhizobium canariense]SDT58657.1 hypothetical protein SAMN05444158_7274 [Bradyrhizobium canariense]
MLLTGLRSLTSLGITFSASLIFHHHYKSLFSFGRVVRRAMGNISDVKRHVGGHGLLCCNGSAVHAVADLGFPISLSGLRSRHPHLRLNRAEEKITDR